MYPAVPRTVPGCVASIAVCAREPESRRRRGYELGQAEVEDLDEPVLRDHQVLGLQIPMDDPGRVSLRQRVGGLRPNREKTLRGERARRQELAQRLSVHELHRDPRTGVRPADVIDRDDVRMVQGRGRARLLLEPREPIRIRGELFGQHLDRHLAAEPCVARPIDLSHSSGAERGDDFKRAQAGARRETHVGGKSNPC